MNCPACGGEDSSVMQSMDSGMFIDRRRKCPCGARWTTKETLIRGTLVAPNKQGCTGNRPKSTESETGGISLSDPIRSGNLFPIPEADPDQTQARVKQFPRIRGKNRQYSEAFETCWKQYGRKEEKPEAYRVWQSLGGEFGGEGNLGVLILGALKWQAPNWAAEGWKFAPYFVRYLKRRRWEDEQTAPGISQSRRDPLDGLEDLSYLSRPRTAKAP